MKKTRKIPSILLIGVGSFGEKHLQTLQRLEKDGVLTVAGAVVSTTASQKKISKKYRIPVWTEITDVLLENIDAVDIVTPPETHLKIALRCLPFAHVLAEKPLATTSADAKKIAACAKKYKRILMVGHILRFDPVFKKLSSLLLALQDKTVSIQGDFINPKKNDIGRDISLELSHFFDIVPAVIKKSIPSIISTSASDRINKVSIQYTNGNHANFRLGWEGDKKIRTLTFLYSDRKISCDFLNSRITITTSDGTSKIFDCAEKSDNLTRELRCFLEVIKGNDVPYPDSEAGIALVEIAEKARNHHIKNKKRPRVAIIGAGIFGTNCAIELSKSCNVTLFEKNSDIMQEASFVNQYRHHWGYHYPRSDETVRDIRNAMGDFEGLYEDAIIRDFPTYYCIAKKDSKVSAADYVKFCRKHKLPFTLEYPDEKYVDRKKISLSLKTLEPIYNYGKLKGLVHGYIKKSPLLDLRLNTSVITGKIDEDGRKTLSIKDGSGKESLESFDYVINATYAQYNRFAQWFNFPIKPVRIDLVEALIVKLPLPRISLAVMDGPFTNLVPTSDDNMFTLVHIKESMLERYVPKDGLPIVKKTKTSRTEEILRRSQEWLPILKEAEVIEKRYIFRAVNAHREHDDARPSDISRHGFGCWSILGGKIINSVTTAKEIAQEIKDDTFNIIKF